MFNALLQKLNHWRDRRRTEEALGRLDDHLLCDIGFYRHGGQYFPTGGDGTPPALGPAVSREMWSRDDLLRDPEVLVWNDVRDAIATDDKATATTDGQEQTMQRGREASAAIVRKAA